MSPKEAAMQAQRAAIKSWMVVHYVGGRKEIARWSDHYFHLSGFSASHASGFFGRTTDQTRRRLDRLAKEGVIERHKTYGPVSYRFPRATCDALAEEVTKELIAEGLEVKP